MEEHSHLWKLKEEVYFRPKMRCVEELVERKKIGVHRSTEEVGKRSLWEGRHIALRERRREQNEDTQSLPLHCRIFPNTSTLIFLT